MPSCCRRTRRVLLVRGPPPCIPSAALPLSTAFSGVEVPLPPTYRLDLAEVASFEEYVQRVMGKNARRNWRLRQRK